MHTRLCLTVSKDNAFQGNCVSSALNSNVISQSNSGEPAYPVAYDSVKGVVNAFAVPDGNVKELAYKYNGKPNYSLDSPPLKTLDSSINGYDIGQPDYNSSVIVIDWLSITFRVLLPNKDADFVEGAWQDSSGRLGIKLDDRRIQHYRYFGKCFLDGVQFGEISFCPYENSVLQKDFARLKIDNELFYSGEWLHYVDEFKAITGAVFNNVARLDIAVDYSWKYGRQVLDFVKAIKMGQSRYRKLGVKNLEFNSREGINDGFTVGKRSGNKSAVFYNKSLEIREHSGKEYITAYHVANGLDASRDVCRFEIRLDGEAVKSVADFSLEKLMSPDYLVSLIKTHINNWFELVPSIAVNVSRAKRFDVLRLEAICSGVSYLERVKRKVKSNTRTVKASIKCLIEQIYLGGNKQQCYSDCIKNLVAVSNLKDWLDRRFNNIVKDLDKKFRFICEPAISVEGLADLLEVNYTNSFTSKQAVA